MKMTLPQVGDTKNLNYPTDFNLIRINLLSAASDDVVDLRPFLVELNIFEDIFSSTISGQVVLSDALGLVSNYRLNGTEFIEVGFEKVKDERIEINRTFRIYKLDNRVIDPSNTKESYVLCFCSEEFLLSEQYRISKSFKSTKISNIVGSILNDYLRVGSNFPGTKKCYIEETTGVYDFVLPNKKIFETINWLSSYALPKNNNGADMIFFESVSGYQFWSLQTLYSQNSFDSYFYNPKNISNDPNQKVKNVLKLEFLDSFDVLGGISKGTFSNRLISLDLLTREYKITDFDYKNYLQKNKPMNGFGVSNIEYKNRLGYRMYESPPAESGLEIGALRLATSNSEQKKKVEEPDAVANDIFIERYLPNRVSQIALSNYTRIRLNIPGNSELSVGMVIEFNAFNMIPETRSTKGQAKAFDKFYSGKYLITAVRHIIKPTSFITVVELAKESNQEYMPLIRDYYRWKNAIYGIQDKR